MLVSHGRSIVIARAVATALLLMAASGCRAGQAGEASPLGTGTAPAAAAAPTSSSTTAPSAVTTSTPATSTRAQTTTPQPVTPAASAVPASAVTHTHFAATWKVSATGRGQTITDARDGSSYSINVTIGGTPSSFRVRGGHLQVCDPQHCQVREVGAAGVANLASILSSIYLDPKTGMPVIVGNARTQPAAAWNGHPVACATGANIVFGGTGRICYLTDVNLLLSMDNNGDHSQLVQLSGDVPASMFDDLPGPLSKS